MKLILKNNDTSTFQDVIASLMVVCKHNIIQAEQCAHLIHLKGKTDIKVSDDLDKLLTMKEQLASVGLETEIES